MSSPIDPSAEKKPQLAEVEMEPSSPGDATSWELQAALGGHGPAGGAGQGGRGDLIIPLALALACLLVPTALVGMWVNAAEARLHEATAAAAGAEPQVAVAAAADEGYCSADLKKILRRVLQSCGLVGAGQGRGCQPLEAKNVAALSGDDFNALFLPLSDRAGIVQFDKDSALLDPSDVALLDQVFTEQKGASYFFVVARSSPEGSAVHNRDLSQSRGGAVLEHLRGTFDDPDLDREVGLLWLGEEFAQLDTQFCSWKRSGPPEECAPEHINRSAFVAWIDCQL
jgi:outer membrane protein OmpA-like peptidoglycan-associated protein